MRFFSFPLLAIKEQGEAPLLHNGSLSFFPSDSLLDLFVCFLLTGQKQNVEHLFIYSSGSFVYVFMLHWL